MVKQKGELQALASPAMGHWTHSPVDFQLCNFYRFSAKRGIGCACRPSVCPSVTLVDQDHIGWKAWKLIARTNSLTPSLFVAQRPHKWGNLGETRGGVKKWRARAQKRQYL